MTTPKFEIQVPGPFVVLQGLPGDGLYNTMDSLPMFPQAEEQQEHGNVCEMNGVPLNVIGSLARQGLFPTMPSSDPSLMMRMPSQTTSSMRTFSNVEASAHDGANLEESKFDAREETNVNLGDSFVVVAEDESVEDAGILQSSHDDGRDAVSPSTEQLAAATAQSSRKTPRWTRASSPQGQTQSQRQERVASLTRYEQASLSEWDETCWKRQCEEYLEWHENCNANRRKCNEGIASLQNAWWLCGGRLAVLDSLPHMMGGRLQRPRILGALAPGTTLICTALVTLQSDDFSVVEIEPTSGKHEVANFDIYPPGREGWIQILQIESSGHNHIIGSGYVVLSRDGYSYLGPNLPCSYTDPLVWIWRVTCIDGAFVREGLDLSSNHIATIPYGSLLQVRRKTVNAMGLSRLQVSANITREHENGSTSSEFIMGWCSEFLNPLSGQRGSIVQPLPFPVPALYRVTFPESAVIRSGIELSSPQIGRASSGAVLTVTGRCFSEHPSERCIERLQLAGNGGWISLRLNKHPPEDLLIVERAGLVDPSFDPEHAGIFHLEALKRVRRQQTTTTTTMHVPPSISSVDEEEEEERSSSSSLSSLPNHLASAVHGTSTTVASTTPMCTYDTLPASVTTRTSTTTAQALCAQAHSQHATSSTVIPPNNDANKCLVCLHADRTATMVHGGTGHIACCLVCARILKARGDGCPVCRLPIESVIQHFWA